MKEGGREEGMEEVGMVSDSAKEWMSSEGKMVAIKWRGWRGKGWRGVRKALHFCGENCTNEY